MALPKLVVFDLDACCWYPEMYMVRRARPSRRRVKMPAPRLMERPSNCWARRGKYGKRLVNGDEWQDCRRRRGQQVRRAGLGAAALKLFTIDDGRSFWQALDDGRLAEIYKGKKRRISKALKQKTGVAFEDMLFFDDDHGEH